jgi:two-component system LytT family response regulator
MRILVIDDEPKARSLLKNIISKLDDDQYEVYEAEDLQSGVKMIRQIKPKLVFLDIEMPNEQGTEILNYFDPEEINFEIVFSTAYSDYALRAFELNAIDYLLKPIRPKKVIDVVKRVRESYNQLTIQKKLHELKETLSQSNFEKIGVPIKDGIKFIALSNIIHLEADGMYTKIHIRNNSSLLISKPLKFFNHILEGETTFYKPHRSHIFNMQYLEQYVKRDGNYALLENGHIIPIAKDKREEFVSLISTI